MSTDSQESSFQSAEAKRQNRSLPESNRSKPDLQSGAFPFCQATAPDVGPSARPRKARLVGNRFVLAPAKGTDGDFHHTFRVG
jgi:hypothetical protein